MEKAIKMQVKELIDTLDDDKAMQVYEYARVLDSRNNFNIQDLKKFRGAVDLDIDLDVLRGRNDFN